MSRPKSLVFLCVILVGLGLFNLLGAIVAYQQLSFLSDLVLPVSPMYLLVSDVVWAGGLGVMAVGLWRRRPWARLGAAVFISLYLAYGWVDRLALSRADFARQSWPALLLMDGLVLGLFWITLLRPKVRQSFERRP